MKNTLFLERQEAMLRTLHFYLKKKKLFNRTEVPPSRKFPTLYFCKRGLNNLTTPPPLPLESDALVKNESFFYELPYLS